MSSSGDTLKNETHRIKRRSNQTERLTSTKSEKFEVREESSHSDEPKREGCDIKSFTRVRRQTPLVSQVVQTKMKRLNVKIFGSDR